MSPAIDKKPKQISSLADLKNFYWLKREIIKTCQLHGLSTQGAKQELINRVECFLSPKKVYHPHKINRQQRADRDSTAPISKNTLVKNYYNDATTREFFVQHIGAKFKFNAYLRQFRDPTNITPNLTYGDLLLGWKLFENERTSSDPIGAQFEYNQFIKDYFHQEKANSLPQAIKAWKYITSIRGPNTYSQFKVRRSEEH